MKRLSTVSQIAPVKIVDYDLPLSQSGDYVVDDSCFTPMSEAVKQLSRTAPLTADEIRMAYDFVDGKDNGMKVPVERMPRTSDIVEIMEPVKLEAQELSAKLSRAKERIVQARQVEQALKMSKSSASDSSSGGLNE